MSLSRKQKKRLLMTVMGIMLVAVIGVIIFLTNKSNDKNKDNLGMVDDATKPKATATPAPTVSPTPTPTPMPTATPVPKDYGKIDEFITSMTSNGMFYTKAEVLKLMEGNFPDDEIEYAGKHYPYTEAESAEKIIEMAVDMGFSKTGFKTYLENRGVDLSYYDESKIDWNKQKEIFKKRLKEQSPDMDDDTIESILRAEGFND